MKSVLFTERGGLKIVIGFGRLSIDPVATKRARQKKMGRTKEFRTLAALLDRIQDLPSNERLEFRGEYLSAASKALDKAALIDSDLFVYAPSASNEAGISDELFDTIIALKAEGKTVTVEGVVVNE